MTRIIAGSARGRRLITPSGAATRPTRDRVREALFASLGDLDGAQVLDLYAGSGALGLEALSRGAAGAVFVERDRIALAALRANIDTLTAPSTSAATVIAADVERFLAGPVVRYDLVLADPPYGDDIDVLLTALQPWVGDRIVLERSTRGAAVVWPAPLEADRSRRYGETTLWYGHSP